MTLHPERVAGDGMKRERPLKIRPRRVSPVALVELRHNAIGFNGSRVDAGIVHLTRNDLGRLRELRLRVPVLEGALMDDVTAELIMEDGRRRRQGVFRFHDRLPRLVDNLDEVNSIFGDVSAFGYDDGNRFAKVPRPLYGTRIVLQLPAD